MKKKEKETRDERGDQSHLLDSDSGLEYSREREREGGRESREERRSRERDRQTDRQEKTERVCE
jgi:hypothetical protein